MVNAVIYITSGLVSPYDCWQGQFLTFTPSLYVYGREVVKLPLWWFIMETNLQRMDRKT